MAGTPTHTRGFTLVEILCVLVLLAIMAMIIIPQLGSRGDLKAAAAARTMMADIMYAQNRAIARQTPQYVSFDTATKTYTLMEGTTPAVITHPVTLNSYEQTFGNTGLEDVTLTSAAFDSKSTIAFDEIGAPYSYDTMSGMVALSSGQIKIASDGYTMTLSLEPYTGEITVTTP
jgi:type II secretion system protein H